jgi:hypothetical protein
MVKILAVSGKENLEKMGFRAEVETYWMPLWGDSPEAMLTLEEAAEVGIISEVKRHQFVAEKRPDGARWAITEYDVPAGAFLASTVRLRHGENLHQQDLLLYVREDAATVRLGVPYIKDETRLLHELAGKMDRDIFFLEGSADGITHEQGNSVGIKFPEKHFFQNQFIPLFTSKEVKTGSKLRSITPRPNVSLNFALTGGKDDESFVIRDHGSARAIDFD